MMVRADKLSVLVAIVAMIALRARYGVRSSRVKVSQSFKSARDRTSLAMVTLAFLAQIVWAVIPRPMFADYRNHPPVFWTGVALFVVSMALLYRAHEDLGTNWSNALELREQHQLITHGIYRRVRHPVYSGMLLWASAIALMLHNWLIGPAYLAAFALLVVLRVGPEERMMHERFGTEYDAYRARTARLIPRLW